MTRIHHHEPAAAVTDPGVGTPDPPAARASGNVA